MLHVFAVVIIRQIQSAEINNFVLFVLIQFGMSYAEIDKLKANSEYMHNVHTILKRFDLFRFSSSFIGQVYLLNITQTVHCSCFVVFCIQTSRDNAILIGFFLSQFSLLFAFSQ